MNNRRLLTLLLCACLLLGLAGCGNKGPLVPPEEPKDERDKTRNSRTY